MQIQEGKRQVLAHGTVGNGVVEFSAAIQIEYPKYQVGPVHFKIVPDMKEKKIIPDDMKHPNSAIIIRGQTEDAKEIIINPGRSFGPLLISGGENSFQFPKQIVYEGDANAFIEGDLNPVDCSDGTIVCNLFITPTALADPRTSYVNYGDTGEVKKEREPVAEPLSWHTPFGVAHITHHYDFKINLDVGNNNGLLRISRPCIRLEMKHSGKLDLVQLINECQDYFDDVLWFISFLSKNRIVWFEGEITFYPDSDSGNVCDLYIRRDKFIGYQRTHKRYDQLISTDVLSEGLFDKLINTYMESKLRPLIHQTIVSILISSERVYFENSYTSIYTALEGVVAELAKKNNESMLFPKKRFSQLREKVKQTIEDEITLEELKERPTLLEDLSAKIPELNRRTFADQLSLLLQSHGIDIGIMFPIGSNTKDELSSLRKRRNDYVHTGKMAEPVAYSGDIARLRYLLEVWILHMLLESHEQVEKLNIQQSIDW